MSESLRFSAGTDSFPMLSHETMISLVADLGFDGHDLTMLDGANAVIPLGEVRADLKGWAKRLDQRVRRHGLEITDVAAWASYETMSPNHPDPAIRQDCLALFRDTLTLASELGAPGVTMVPGTDWPGESHDASFDRACEAMRIRADEAGSRGLAFSVEPHIGSVCHSPAEVTELCERAPGLQLTLDYSHYTCQGFSDDEIEPLLGYARHVHARGSAEGRLQTSMKANTIDYERLVDRLLDLNYNGFVQVEYVWVDWGGLNEVDVLSETVLMLDRLRSRATDKPWSYPEFAWPIDDA